MNPKQILDALLDGEEWYLTRTETGRAEITAILDGEVVIGKIECNQLEKSSSDDSTITVPAQETATGSLRREPLAYSSH